jgi:HAD superfamily hydrolase (TIGR01509 family)
VQCYIFDPEYTIHFSVPAPSVKNLIFDLGGVILDLSVDHTIHAFSRLSGIEPAQVKKIYSSAPEFEHFETGAIKDSEFRDFIRKVYKTRVPDTQIDHCWNQMLRGIPEANLALLLKLKQKYNVYLLSNTNNIHLSYINQNILKKETGQNHLDIYFHRAYYSHIMGKRKPNADTYEDVLQENGLQPSETLFLDDNEKNIEGAKTVGIKTLYVTNPNMILDVFND